MIYLCHLLVFILPGGCCQRRGLLFTTWQLHLKRDDSPCKNSASKQIRPEPLKRSGYAQDPFSLHVSQMMRQQAQICITSVPLCLLSGGSLRHLKKQGLNAITPRYCICCCFYNLTLELCIKISLIDYLRHCPQWGSLSLCETVPPPSLRLLTPPKSTGNRTLLYIK